MNRNEIQQQINRENGIQGDGRPHVVFYDSAVLDPVATRAEGRNKYRDVVMVEKTPTASDLVVRDRHVTNALPEHKEEFPQEWQEYLTRKGDIANRSPVLQAIPGMTPAALYEFRDLGIVHCEQLVNYTGDLGEHEQYRELARKIMEVSQYVSNQARSGSERAANAGNPERRVHDHSQATPRIAFENARQRVTAGADIERHRMLRNSTANRTQGDAEERPSSLGEKTGLIDGRAEERPNQASNVITYSWSMPL